MIAPKPFKFKCPQCGYSKIVRPKSDVLNPTDWNSICPKCKATMNKVELSLLDKIFWR
jgi:Zn finger protein HypA/HybF involved in hydrogenase expression